MKVPKYIQAKMHKVASLHKQANTIMKEIDVWFEQQGYSDEFLRSGNGIGLEELEYGEDVTDKLVKAAEEDFSGIEWQ